MPNYLAAEIVNVGVIIEHRDDVDFDVALCKRIGGNGSNALGSARPEMSDDEGDASKS